MNEQGSNVEPSNWVWKEGQRLPRAGLRAAFEGVSRFPRRCKHDVLPVHALYSTGARSRVGGKLGQFAAKHDIVGRQTDHILAANLCRARELGFIARVVRYKITGRNAAGDGSKPPGLVQFRFPANHGRAENAAEPDRGSDWSESANSRSHANVYLGHTVWIVPRLYGQNVLAAEERRIVVGSCAKRAFISSNESPPSFSASASASTRQTAASTTTTARGTGHTSLRS